MLFIIAILVIFSIVFIKLYRINEVKDRPFESIQYNINNKITENEENEKLQESKHHNPINEINEQEFEKTIRLNGNGLIVKKEGVFYFIDNNLHTINKLPYDNIEELVNNNVTIKYLKFSNNINSNDNFEKDDFLNNYYLNEMSGIMNEKLEVIIPAKYTFIETIKEYETYFIVSECKFTPKLCDEDYRITESIGEIDSVRTYENNGFGVIDINENVIIPLEYSQIYATPFKNEFLAYKGGLELWYRVYQDEPSFQLIKGKWGIVNTNNEILVPFEYDIFKIEDDRIKLQINESITLFNDFDNNLNIFNYYGNSIII